VTAVRALIDGQAAADRRVGLDWGRLTEPASRLDEPLRRAHARLPVYLSHPAVYVDREDQRQAFAARLGLNPDKAGDVSRWALANPCKFHADDLRWWRIGSGSWLALGDERLGSVQVVQRLVGLFLALALATEGWQLAPVLPLDARRAGRPRPVRRDASV